MVNFPQEVRGLKYVKECNLVEAWHEYMDVSYIFLRDFNGVLCHVLLDEDFNYETDEFDIMIDSRADLGYNVDVRVYVYEDVLLKVHELLKDIASSLASASNMDVHYERGTMDKEQSEHGKRGMLEKAEQLGYKAMQAIDAFKQKELEELLGVENGRKLFYAASAVRSRTYQALDGSQSIDDVRIFINELLTLVELPKFPTPPPVTKARYAVVNDNLYGHLIMKRGIQNVTDDCIIGRFDSPADAMRCALKVSNDTSDKIVVYDYHERIWLAAIELSPDSDDFVEYDTDEQPDIDRDISDAMLAFVSPDKTPVSLIVESDSFAEQIYDTDSDWVRAGLQESLNLRTQETYTLRDEIKALNAQLKDLHNIGAEFEQMQQERDDWKLRCESAKLELIEAKRRADDARQETLRWKDAYAASEDSNKKLFYQRHKMAKQLMRRRHPRVVALLK